MPPHKHLVLLAAVASWALVACASKADPVPQETNEAVEAPRRGPVTRTGSDAVTGARTSLGAVPDAATETLQDLNLTRDEIPDVLQFEYVYGAYPPPTCHEIAVEVTALDEHLGRDYDQEAAEKKSLGYKGGEAVGDLVVDTIRGFTTDIIPFRDVVREATGAASNERKRARAFAAGISRRAYLKGLALGQGCEPPAAPRVIVPPSQTD